jgi:site-specific recombinase XerD
MARKYVTNTTRDNVNLLKRFYLFLHKQREIKENPARGMTSPKGENPLPPNPPDAETIFKLISSIGTATPISTRNAAMIEVLFSTGLRLSEFVSLELSDVRLKDRTILVRSGKGNKDRITLLSKRATTALMLYLEKARPALLAGLPGQDAWKEHAKQHGRHAGSALWLAAHGGAICKATIHRQFEGWAEDFGIKIYPHLLRHAMAVTMLRKGADIRHVQVLLGHDNLDTTKIYLRLVKEDYKRAYDRAFPKITLRLPR